MYMLSLWIPLRSQQGLCRNYRKSFWQSRAAWALGGEAGFFESERLGRRMREALALARESLTGEPGAGLEFSKGR